MPATATKGGWAALFGAAFRDSRNAMVLLDEQRRQIEANNAYLRLLGQRRDDVIGRPVYEFVADGPHLTSQEWARLLLRGERVTGEIEMRTADGGVVAIQWGATPEVVTGQRLVLVVALRTSRWGRRFRREVSADADDEPLSPREQEIVRMVALGATGKEIADELLIAHETVRTHVRNAMGKVNARSRAHLVAKALAEGHF